ncbi:retrovirus-related pol polyprotein from transposon TNT 1-94 [Tanacetum coccineum]
MNNLPPKWSKFVTDVKLARDLHTTNFDQLYSYLEQHEAHANETRLMRERYQDPLAFVANFNQPPSHITNYPSLYNTTQFPQQTNIMIPQVHSPQSYLSINVAPHLSQLQISHLSIPPSQQFQSHMDHQTSCVPQIAYHSPQVLTQPMTEFPQLDSGLVVYVFTQGDDPIVCLNKAMAFLSAVVALRYPSTNNQLRTSSNPRNQATIQDGGQARVVKCYICQGEGHMARQCTQPKRPRNAAWFKDKAMLAEAQESSQILDEEQLAFLVDLGILDSQAAQTTIPNNVAFQTKDLDAYDSDCDDVSTTQAVQMANLSNYRSDVISEVPHSEPCHHDMDNQSVHAMQDFKQTLVVNFTDNKITSDSNIIPYSQYLQETQQAVVQDTNLYAQQDSMILSVIEQILNIDLSTRENMIDSQMDDMIKEKLALKQQIDSLEQNLSNQIKEKDSLLQTFTVFKNESKEKKSKYIDKEIDLEKKIKELDNIVYKVGDLDNSTNNVLIPLDSWTSGLLVYRLPLSGTASRLRPYHFTYPKRELTMEEILHKFIDEGKLEHEEMGAFIKYFKTTNEILLKERDNSLIELRFEVQKLSRIIESPPTSNYEIKGVTTRGGKMTTQDVQKDDTNMNGEEPYEEARDKSVESNEVLIENQPQGTNEPIKRYPREKIITLAGTEKLKEAEDLAADHLSRFESLHMEVLTEMEIADKFSDEHIMELKSKFKDDEPCQDYFLEEPYAFKLCTDNIIRRCVAGSETLEIMAHCHSGPTGGHHSANVTVKKVYEAGFYWPSVFKDANEYVRRCDACQRSENISSTNEMPQNNIQDSDKCYFSKFSVEYVTLKTKSNGASNIVKTVYPHGAIEITDRDVFSFKVNGKRLKKYYEGDIDKEDDELLNKAHVILLPSQLMVNPKKDETTEGIIRNYYDREDDETTLRFRGIVGKKESGNEQSHVSIPWIRSTGTLSIGAFRNERVVGATEGAVRQGLYKTQFLTLGSSGLVCQEERRIIPDVH